MRKLVATKSTIVNARIAETQFGYEGHGIMTCYLLIEGDGWCCNFGGYALDSWNNEESRRVGTAQGFNAVIELMKTLEVEKWEDLKGKYIRCETEGWGGRITKVGHMLKGRWFSF